jgi:hypothetical protein
MDQMMAYCGVMCDKCPAYIATVDNNDELRKNTAEKWSKIYKDDIHPEQINCLGCRSGTRFYYCQICGIRACAIEKQLPHCGECDSFPCSKVNVVLDHMPSAKKRLEAGRKNN